MATPSLNTQAVTTALAAISGPANVQETAAAIVVAPAETAEVAAILRYANEHRLPVAPTGGGTKQGWGNPVTPVISIDTCRMHALREHTWQDMTCTVEAGCTWSALQNQLAEHRQFVALDPLWPERATVGGIVAANDSGALRLRYGGLRDLIIGMTIVLANGTVANTGGKVVQNVAGYDLHKLMIGAFGTLGFITSVNFRLHSIPQTTQTFTVSAAAAPLRKLLLALLDAQLSTISIQLRGEAHRFHLDVRFASLPEVLSTQAQVLGQMAGSAGLAMEPASDEVWSARQHMMERDVVAKGTMLPSEIARLAEQVRELGGESVTQATGIMMAGFPASAAEGVVRLRAACEAGSGSLTILKQPAEAGLSCWGTLPDSLPLMREIKRNFDPNRILNPGRFLGGI
jgi:glycolate oxidase FAD binding subunit